MANSNQIRTYDSNLFEVDTGVFRFALLARDNGTQVTGMVSGKFDFTKSYARRRPDEPKSHYNARVKFIQALLKAEGDVLTDDQVEVFSHCFSNVK